MSDIPPPPIAADAPAVAPLSPPWWREVGDPVLATLVQQGLDINPDVICRIASLRQYDHQAEQDARRIGSRLGRLLGDKSVRPDPQIRSDKVERVSLRRERLARQIALAYVEVRRLQQDVALRGSLRDQYKDNTEVAQFRREAGLAPAIDGSLARSQDETAQGELGFAQGRLDDAIGELARLVGDKPDALAAKIGSPGAIPDPAVDPLSLAPPEEPRRVAVADAVLREARLTQTLEEARRTVRDARTAYREGAGGFSTLYVAEAAALAVDLALVDARARRVEATLDLWSGRDGSWARGGLEPVVAPDPSATGPTITVTAACD
ncbi:RND transporter [Novosphingobium resinovorum]|uniref:RND transporter n=1 Tax=Novosphingobium resinovorum TaxID=158500 RepID=UPI002ED26065|nr:RND transporter [Novosphingobium resinovorum]